MKAKQLPEIDYLSLPPRKVAQLLQICDQLGITPQKASALMAEETAAQRANLPAQMPLLNPHPPKKTTKKQPA